MSTSSTPTPDANPPSLGDPGSSCGATRPQADASLREALHRVWGFSDFRPLQREAMHAILDRRDSVVVLPTGGGKSLCFQAPAVVDDPWQPRDLLLAEDRVRPLSRRRDRRRFRF